MSKLPLPTAAWYDEFAKNLTDIAQGALCFMNTDFPSVKFNGLVIDENDENLPEEHWNYLDMAHSVGSVLFLKYALIIGESAGLIQQQQINDHLAEAQKYTDSELNTKIITCDTTITDLTTYSNQFISFGTSMMCGSLLDSYYCSDADDNSSNDAPRLAKTLMGAYNAFEELTQNPTFKSDGLEAFAHFSAAMELFRIKELIYNDDNPHPDDITEEVMDHASILQTTYFMQNNPDILLQHLNGYTDETDEHVYNWAVEKYKLGLGN